MPAKNCMIQCLFILNFSEVQIWGSSSSLYQKSNTSRPFNHGFTDLRKQNLIIHISRRWTWSILLCQMKSSQTLLSCLFHSSNWVCKVRVLSLETFYSGERLFYRAQIWSVRFLVFTGITCEKWKRNCFVLPAVLPSIWQLCPCIATVAIPPPQ